jgi:hypothetical protein
MCRVKKRSTKRNVATETLAAEIVKEQSHMTTKRKGMTDGSRKLQTGTIDFFIHEEAHNKPGFEEGKRS